MAALILTPTQIGVHLANHEADRTPRARTVDLDSFQLLSSAGRSQVWTALDTFDRVDLVIQILESRGHTVTGDSVDVYIAVMDERFSAPVAAPLPPSAVLQAIADELAGAAHQAGDERNMHALDKAAYALAEGIRVERGAAGLLIPSATSATIYRVAPDRGCTCRSAAHGKPCWHAALLEIVTVAEERAIALRRAA
jgi:hypothetical protein